MKTIRVRNLLIGSGAPKICVSVMGKEEKELKESVGRVITSPVDIIEWRMDYLADVRDFSHVMACGKTLRKMVGDIPLLTTFRTAQEGGEKEISLQDYVELNTQIAREDFADMMDVEIYRGAGSEEGKKQIEKLIALCHEQQKIVVGSYHDFSKTPEEQEILERLYAMDKAGADIPKIALMPENFLDVCKVLKATAVAKQQMDKPLITMAMGGIGGISRVAGEYSGSAVTFGCVGKSSAPGQIETEQLLTVLDILHENIG